MAIGGRGFRLDGDPHWEDELRRASGMHRMLGHAGEIVTQGAKRRAPTSPDGSNGRPSGYGRSAIGWELGEDAEGPYVDVASPATTPDGTPYMLIQELGSDPHPIDSHGAYPLRDKHGRVFGRHVEHPGTQPQPHLRPALDDLRGQNL
jgi:hypothetical protein